MTLINRTFEDVRTVREASNLCAVMFFLHRIGRHRALAVLDELHRTQNTLRTFLIMRIQSACITGPAVFYQHLCHFSVIDPNDPKGRRQTKNVYQFLWRLLKTLERT